MSCIGVLYKSEKVSPQEPVDRLSTDLHINYWKLPRKCCGYNRFLDFGLFVNNANDINSLQFYLPFHIEKSNLTDLGNTMAKDNLLSVLFNEKYKIETFPDAPEYKHASSMSSENPKPDFWLYCLSNTDFDVEKLSKGTLIKVSIKTKPPEVKNKPREDEHESSYNLYIRFRIRNLLENQLGFLESVSNDFFQNAFSKTEMVNMYINSLEEFDENDYKTLVSDYSFVSFNKIHFFFVGSSKDERVLGMTNYTDCRLLDSTKWHPYIGDNNPNNRKCLAYHWKKDGPVESSNFFFRTVFSNANFWIILKYCLVIVVLGAISSYAASYIPIWNKQNATIEKTRTSNVIQEDNSKAIP